MTTPEPGADVAAPGEFPPTRASAPIVGIGCSAGGLKALDEFFSHVPADSGLAFVVVQHLDPSRASSLPHLLQRSTSMPVVEVLESMPALANRVHVIAPGKDLSVRDGVLHLSEPASARGQRLPVDVFLRSLAEDRQAGAIGVILSGMGSDGVLGLRAIKERFGLVVVQQPDTAQSDSMPRSAIEAGLPDIVAPAAEMPARILSYQRCVSPHEPGDWPFSEPADDSLESVLLLLRERCGNDFSLYKASTLHRRLERRLALHHLPSLAEYVSYLRHNPTELDLLCKELLIGVTRFFRDAELWDTLRQRILPEWLTAHPGGARVRAWVPACSSGEEAYSLAIVFRETLAAVHPSGYYSLQIYATDLDADAIDRARKGVFPKNIEADVSAERLSKYFVVEPEGYRVSKEIRDMLVFAVQNVISDPPFTRIDILSCRNLLIYFRPELQKRLLPVFHYALNRGGILMLGSAETVGGHARLFSPDDIKRRIFRRLDHPEPSPGLRFPSRLPPDLSAANATVSGVPMRAERKDSLEQLVDQFIQQHYAPAAVLVNAEGDILYFSGRTGKYLEPAAGKVNVNIHAMAREGLREAIAGLIRKAMGEVQPIQLNGVRVGANGASQIVNVTLRGLDQPEALRGKVLVVFHDVATVAVGPRARKSAASLAQDSLAQELHQTREALRTNREESQRSVEELKSSNEELQSINEELQSANEELTTSKEEMQSLNEELQTVNVELQARVADLTWERNDMSNLLNSTEIATVFLDNEMALRRFTPLATRLFKLIPSDIGRPLSDIVTVLDYPKLLDDASEVLRTLRSIEQQVSTRDGRWYRVRIMPYRTQDNVIDGVVTTFVDISDIKLLEDELRAMKTQKS